MEEEGERIDCFDLIKLGKEGAWSREGKATGLVAARGALVEVRVGGGLIVAVLPDAKRARAGEDTDLGVGGILREDVSFDGVDDRG